MIKKNHLFFFHKGFILVRVAEDLGKTGSQTEIHFEVRSTAVGIPPTSMFLRNWMEPEKQEETHTDMKKKCNTPTHTVKRGQA